jgi:membrane protease YdiL (CAAX protease family)
MSTPEEKPEAAPNIEQPIIAVPEWAVPQALARAPETLAPGSQENTLSLEPALPPQHADVPAELRVVWGWSDVVIFAMFYLGSTVAVGVVLLLLLAGILHQGVSALANNDVIKANVAIIAQAIASGLALLYFWLMVRLRNGGPFWAALGWRPFGSADPAKRSPVPLYLGCGLGLAVVVSLLSKFVSQQEALPIEELFQSRETIILLMIFGILVAPLVEETIFRGFFYPVVARSFGVLAGILVTGTLFGMSHAAQLWGGWGQIGLLVGVGVVMTWVRVRRHTVLASYLLHVAYNTTLFAEFVIATGGLRHLSAGS